MSKAQNIELGDEVRDRITGYRGIVVCYATWLNGCVRITVQAKNKKDGTPVDPSCADVEQQDIVKKAVEKAAPPKTNGPTPAQRLGKDQRR